MRPNIILILADDLGYGDCGFIGGEGLTPNMDRLASGGSVFDQFYGQPQCTPCRAALMTGRWPWRYGLQNIIVPWVRHGLRLSEVELPRILKGLGYSTHLVGKWHLGFHSRKYIPTSRGFDHHYGCYTGTIDYYEHANRKALDWHRDGKPLREEGYVTDLLTAEALKVVSKPGPYFLYLPYTAPHVPIQPPNHATFATPRENYCAVVRHLDECVGRIGERLDDNTLLIVMADNGACVHVGGGSVGPLRGAKLSCFEGGVRVPMFMRGPGVPRRRIHHVAHAVDMFATILEAAGGKATGVDGVSLWPMLADGVPVRHEVVHEAGNPKRNALRYGDWKLVWEKGGTFLFNVESDPCEEENLAEKMPSLARLLSDRLSEYNRKAKPYVEFDDPPPNLPKVWEPGFTLG